MKTFHCYTVTPSESYDKEGNIKSTDFFIDIRNQHSEIQAENLKGGVPGIQRDFKP